MQGLLRYQAAATKLVTHRTDQSIAAQNSSATISKQDWNIMVLGDDAREAYVVRSEITEQASYTLYTAELVLLLHWLSPGWITLNLD